jgi:hypothetical protein
LIVSEYIGHITEETWPEARAILDAFRVDYRTTPDRYGGRVKGYNVWVEAENLHAEPWWEELTHASRDGRVVWRVEGQGYGDGEL